MEVDKDPFRKWFDERVETIASTYSGEPTLLLFLGLSNIEARFLADSPHASPILRELLDAAGNLSLNELQASRKRTLDALRALGSTTAMLYEQSISISGFLSDHDLFENKIVIVRGDADDFLDHLTPQAPACACGP